MITVSSSCLSGVGDTTRQSESGGHSDSSLSYFAKKNGQLKLILWYKCYLIDTLHTSTVKSTEL